MCAVAVLFSVASCSTCNNDEEVVTNEEKTEISIPTKYFSAIDIDAACDVYFKQAGKTSIKVVGKENVVNNLTFENDGETLKIDTKSSHKGKSKSNKTDNPVVYIYSPDLCKVMHRGVGTFRCEDKLNTDTLRVMLTGVGNMKFTDIICDHLATSLSGVGNVKIGEALCETAKLAQSGVGNLDIKLSKTKHVNATLTAVGSMDICFDDCVSADCKLTGVGNMRLKGNVKSLKKHSDGIGRIKTKELSVGSEE